jgi:hypothetical protein
MASTMPAEIKGITGKDCQISDDELRELLLRRVIPAGVGGRGSDITAKLLQSVDAFWKDIDSCYEDDWERPSAPVERRWICEYVVEGRNGG